MKGDIIAIPQAKGGLPAWIPKFGGDNMFQFLSNGKNPWPFFKKLAEDPDHSEIFQAKVASKTLVFITGHKLVEEVCNEQRFRKQVTPPIKEIQTSVNIALFTAYHNSSQWPVHHNIIAPKLTKESVQHLFGDFLNTTNELFDMWRDLGPGAKIEPLAQLDRLNLEATTLSLFGKKLNYLDKPHPMLKGMDDSTGEAVQRPNRKLPWEKFLYRNKLRDSTEVMRTYAQDLIDYRKQNPTDRKDLLAAMMEDTAKDPESNIPRKLRNISKTESEVVDEIVSMPIGSSTAPCAIAGGMYYLAKNQRIVDAARKELDAVVGDYEISYENIGQLKYIEGIVRESLRLSFAAPGFNIEPIHTEGEDTGPVFLTGENGKYEIKYNQGMIVVLAGASRDKKAFLGGDGNEFKPERMIGEKYDELPEGVKKYYGNGKRECIGKHYAWLWQMVVMAKLIKEFDFELANPKYELHHYGWFNERPVDFWVKITPRQSSKKYSL
ncbi:Bifunctional cytochrome P450/NADPH--P450 reductase [Colletotrichum sp. SAR 10_99]|nr:Bifunctional cytochrome P450/NADPH--P450 reductase [Colletotrichum sp. SAR 10_96]KAI8266206.1 Bifunctional cytochrome P450/NADPH--P450 reductase [Colletotrichum sp. SAR 10_98]KAJ5017411.1 Bifunctional cytochrome P450/NADPH--P450 reductase [Colletotrichum sp. SAR 10_99]